MELTVKKTGSYVENATIFRKANGVYSEIQAFYCKIGGVYVSLERVFETLVGTQTFVTPVEDFGSPLKVGGYSFEKVDIGLTGDEFNYILKDPIDIESTLNVSGVNNTSSAVKTLGSVKAPGDSFNQSPNAVLYVHLVSGGTGQLAGSTVYVNFSDYRTGSQYRASHVFADDFTPSEETLELPMEVVSGSKVLLTNTPDVGFTPPYASGVMDMNTIGLVSFPIYFKYNTAVGSATRSLVSATATLHLEPPAAGTYDPEEDYRLAYKQPFVEDDMWNIPIPDTAVSAGAVHTYNPAISGNTTSGTISVSATSGSDVITVGDNSNVEVGMFPILAYVKVAVGEANPTFPVGTQSRLTYERFGSGTYVTEVLGSNQIRLSQAAKSTFTERGLDGSGNAFQLDFYSSAETLSIRMGRATHSTGITSDTTIGLLTGVDKTSDYALAYPDGIPRLRISESDPIRRWNFNYIVTHNPWFHQVLASWDDSAFGELFEDGYLYMKTPAILNNSYIEARANTDKNVVLITADGRYSLEMQTVTYNSTTQIYACSRIAVTDLKKRSTSSILDRPEHVTNGISDGIRMYGASFSGGMLTEYDFEGLPDSTATETPEQVAVNVAAVLAMPKHALAQVVAGSQLKSNNYCPDPTVQGTKVAFKGYISQLRAYRMGLVSGGSGYAVDEVLECEGGVFLAPVRILVRAVDGGGAITDWDTLSTGQYKTLPSDTANITTKSLGAGTGAVFTALTRKSGTTQTESAAFPNVATQNIFTYPGTVCDSGYSTHYSGSIEAGAQFRINPDIDLSAIWIAGRIASPTSNFYSYENLWIWDAAQRWGVYITDITINTHFTVVGSRGIPDAQWTRCTGVASSGRYSQLNFFKENLEYVYAPSGLLQGTSSAPVILPLYPNNN